MSPHAVVGWRVTIGVFFVLLALGAAKLSAQAPDAVIAAIRARYALINSSATQLRRETRQLDAYATRRAELTAFFAGDSLRKVIVRFEASARMQVEEYYFWNDALFFVNTRVAVPEGEEGQSQLREDNRYYFLNDTLIRWIDDRGREIVLDQDAGRRAAAEMLSRASEFRLAAQRPRRR